MTSEFESPIEETIGAAVAELGYQVIPQVGAGSFRVGVGVRDPRNPDSFVLGIETDGFSYRDTPTARDRDRLRDEVLTDLKWRVHRIWSLDWVRNRQSEIDRFTSRSGRSPSI